MSSTKDRLLHRPSIQLAGQERKVRRLPSLMYSMVFGRLITFAVGFAAGVYADQNFEVPKIKPDEYYEKIKEIIAQTKKDKDR